MRNFERPGRSAAFGTRGMAATSAPLATLAAVDTRRLFLASLAYLPLLFASLLIGGV